MLRVCGGERDGVEGWGEGGGGVGLAPTLGGVKFERVWR